MSTPAPSAKPGLFSATAFVRDAEREEFDSFTLGYLAELSPQSLLEETFAREIVHAAWRLRRCTEVETNPPETATPEDLDGLQTSIDRARASAQRSLHRSLAELRRLQTERVYRAIALPAGFDPENIGQASCRRLDPAALVIKQASVQDAVALNAIASDYRQRTADSAKQTQSPVVRSAPVARNAPCPCGSREKYKRCCGKNAPPVLSGRAAGNSIPLSAFGN